jgi:hypothetical protein
MPKLWKPWVLGLLLLTRGAVLFGQADQNNWQDLEGLWWVRVEGLSIWAPPESREKELALVLWELSFVDGKLGVKQYAPGAEDPVLSTGRLRDLPFKALRVRNLVVEDSFLSFKVKLASAYTYETYYLETVSDDAVTGTYLIYNPWGAPGQGPEYRGRLYLERVIE